MATIAGERRIEIEGKMVMGNKNKEIAIDDCYLKLDLQKFQEGEI